MAVGRANGHAREGGNIEEVGSTVRATDGRIGLWGRAAWDAEFAGGNGVAMVLKTNEEDFG